MDESFRALVPVACNTKAYQDKIEALYNKYIKGFSGQITITGGAVRDIILNKPIRDIDIYILEWNFPEYMAYLDGLEITEDTFYDDDKASKEDKEMYCHLPIRRRIVGRYKGDMVDILCMRNNFDVTAPSISSLHTVGISQCGIKKDGSIYTSELFHKDVKDKMITMTRLDWGHAKSMKYFMKLYDKYQYPLRIAPKKEDNITTVSMMTGVTATLPSWVGVATTVTP